MFGRQKAATVVAEFLGTGVITLVFLSVLRSQLALGFFIAIAAGLALVIMSFAVGKLSGGYFNPALTIGAWTARQLNTATALVFIVVQFLGAYLAYLLFTYLVKNELPAQNTEFNGRVLAAEITGTAILAFGYAASLAYQKVSSAGYATMSGLSYVVGLLVASSVLGLAFLNPAISLGARTWEWSTYALGPVIGAVIGFGLYQLLFAAADAPIVAQPAKAAVDAPKEELTPKKPTRAAKATRVAKTTATAKRTTAKRKTTTRSSRKRS